MNLTRTLAAALAIAALAAPAAQARPADATSSSTAKNQQDARPQERVGAYTPGSVPAVSYASGQNAAPARPVLGPPTWPVGPKPLTPAPADEGNGLDGTTTALGIAGCLLAVCGIGAAVQNRRTRRARRISVAA
jgi:hypothetical protein